MDVNEKYRELLFSLSDDDRGASGCISIVQDEMDCIFSEKDCTSMEDGIKIFLDQLYDAGTLNVKQNVVAAGHYDSSCGRKFSIMIGFSKTEKLNEE